MGKRLKRGYWWRGSRIWARDPVTGKRCSTGCTDPIAAELWRAERERLAASPAHRAATQATIGGWVRRVLAIKKAERAAGTLHMYEVKLGHVVRIFGGASPMACVTPSAVDGYVTQRRSEGAGSNTIARELTCLRQLLRYARRAGEYAGDIADVMPIGFSAEYVPVTRTLAREDLPLLLAALRTDTERAWVCLALTFAADASDVHRMRPEDFDEARNLFHVRGTKNRARDAELPVLRMFAQLFAYAYPRLPLEWSRSSKGLGEACKRAGLPHLSPKDLRRSTITWLAEAGVSQELASRLARHLGDQMVRRIYAQIAPRALGSLIEAQLGTDTSQQLQRPLGGTADAGDLKGHSTRAEGLEASGKHAVRPGLARGESARADAIGSTDPSHPAGAWALAFAAHGLGLRGCA